METKQTALLAAAAFVWIFGFPTAATAQRNNREQQQQLKLERQQDKLQQRQARQWQQQRGWVLQGGGWQGNNRGWTQNRAQQFRVQQRSWVQRGGYGGYVIPQNRFSLQFGVRNMFRLYNRPTIVRGYPHFRYGGYQFMMADPWPENWGDDWYRNDDVYIDYDDGYYLHNRRDPGFRIAISVVL
jgi:type II secretory pathway pseudopilin PulG